MAVKFIFTVVERMFSDAEHTFSIAEHTFTIGKYKTCRDKMRFLSRWRILVVPDSSVLGQQDICFKGKKQSVGEKD